jgi:biopolymer transport protein TolQ
MLLTPSLYVASIVGAAPIEKAYGSDLVQMVLNAGPIVKLVMLILLLFSVVCWAIIFMKIRYFRRAKAETAFFLDLFWETGDWNKISQESEDLPFSPVSCVFMSGLAEFKRALRIQRLPESESNDNIQPLLDNVERSVRKATADQTGRMERALSFLATTGNTAPFIGLFGTVWGIMESFRSIGLKGSASLAVVAPGISEALIATAAGLAAAIPAVIAYNYFSNKVNVFRTEMDTFTSDFLSLSGRRFLRGSKAAK